MGKLIAGMASSHAATLVDPSSWGDHRTRNRQRYASRYGSIPPEQPQVALETIEDLQCRYTHIRDGLENLRHKLEQVAPDALIIVGDDQNENFHVPFPFVKVAFHRPAYGRPSALTGRSAVLAGSCECYACAAAIARSKCGAAPAANRQGGPISPWGRGVYGSDRRHRRRIAAALRLPSCCVRGLPWPPQPNFSRPPAR